MSCSLGFEGTNNHSVVAASKTALHLLSAPPVACFWDQPTEGVSGTHRATRTVLPVLGFCAASHTRQSNQNGRTVSTSSTDRLQQVMCAYKKSSSLYTKAAIDWC